MDPSSSPVSLPKNLHSASAPFGDVSHPKTISMVVYFGLPALGKSFFADFVTAEAKKHGAVSNTVSIDQVCLPIINKARQANPEKRMMKIYAESALLIGTTFEEEVRKTLDNLTDPLNLVFVDAVRIEDDFLDYLASRADFKPVKSAEEGDSPNKDKHHLTVIIPKVAEQERIEGYPFSAQLLMNLCVRALHRKGHETLTTDNYTDVEKLKVVLYLAARYKAIPCLKTRYLKGGNAKFAEVQFHMEKLDNKGASSPKLIQDIYAQIVLCLKDLEDEEKRGKEATTEDLTKLLALLETLKADEQLKKDHIGYGDQNQWKHAIDTMIAPIKEEALLSPPTQSSGLPKAGEPSPTKVA